MKTFTDLRVPALHSSVRDVLPLSPRERHVCQVFALGADLSHDESIRGRFAIARPVSREELASLPCGQVVLYGGVIAEETIETVVGELRRYDLQRGLLYTSCWFGGEVTEASFDDNSLRGAWAVERFISCAA